MKNFYLLLVFILCAMMGINTNTLDAQSPVAKHKKAAFVASDAGLSLGFDGAIFDRLASLGYDVRVVTSAEVKGGSFTIADAESLDLLVVSESIGSGDVIALTGAAVPILHMESFGWSKMGWALSGNRGWTAPLMGDIDIANVKHTVLSKAGLSAGSLDWFTVDSLQATYIGPSNLVPGTVILAQEDTSVISWAIEKGVMLANGTPAAARILAFPLPGYSNYPASVLTDGGWAFFDAAVAWLGTAPTDFVGSTAIVASDAGLSLGFDGAIYDRLASLGYDVRVVTSAEVKGGSFTIADAESLDLLVVS
ncbi:MAG: hypothetical protein R6W31_04945, partial [Bacteroidales bacterium]